MTPNIEHNLATATNQSNSAQNQLQTNNLQINLDNMEVTVTNDHPWQVVANNKRKRVSSPDTELPPLELSKRYLPLANLSDNNLNDNSDIINQEQIQQPKIDKPPPIFVHGVINYREMVKNFTAVLEEEQIITKALTNNVIKVNVRTTDNFRKLIKHMKDANIIHHTYQLKEERAYRVVIRHLHQSTPIEEIQDELESKGFKVRNIVNVKHRSTKESLPLFFVDLEPAENNKSIYDLKYLQNRAIRVEPPYRNTDIAQCTRCQMFNHTKTYCNRPYACVKCGGAHDTKTCKKPSNTKATCYLCNGDHPASYKGCQVYRELQNKFNKNQHQQKNDQTSSSFHNASPSEPIRTNKPTTSQTYYNSNNQRTYSEALRNKSSDTISHPEDISLSKFLNEFREMFQQVMQQNNMMINLLNTVIQKLIR